MGFDLIGPAITLALAAIGGIVWLVRLEGRINSNKQGLAEVVKDLGSLDTRVGHDITTITAKADAEAAAHRETASALIRVQEQLKYMTNLLERYVLGEGSKPRSRRPSGE